MAAINWVFSDGPANAMREFIMKHPEDERSLLLQNKLWQKDVRQWLGTKFNSQGDNAFHAALFSRNANTIDRFIESSLSHHKYFSTQRKPS
jgi:hypothetical protein